METMKQVIYKKNGSSEWNEMGPTRTLSQFNRDFHDWVLRYKFPREKILCENWEDALEVLNTVGASSIACQFRLLPAVNTDKQKSLTNVYSFDKCALYNELGGYEGLFNLTELADYMDADGFKDWKSAQECVNKLDYKLVKL